MTRLLLFLCDSTYIARTVVLRRWREARRGTMHDVLITHTLCLGNQKKSVPGDTNLKCSSLLSRLDVVVGYVGSHVNRVPYRRRMAFYEALWAPAPVHRTCAVNKHAESARIITNQCEAVGIPQKLCYSDYLAWQPFNLCSKFCYYSVSKNTIRQLRCRLLVSNKKSRVLLLYYYK
jgi:hypothetical protein